MHNLNVSKGGTGSGTVTSSPAGISCGTDCSEPYVHGATVTLTALPYAGSLFAGWSGGGCSGTGTCTVAITGNITVIATFNVETAQYGGWNRGYRVDTCDSDSIYEFTCPSGGAISCIDTAEDDAGAPFWRTVTCN